MINPFISPFSTPFGVPPFDIIQENHYSEAISLGIESHKSEIAAIKACKDAPTFENIILSLENAGQILSRVSHVMFNLSYANTSESLQEIVQLNAPIMTAHSDSIYMDDALFEKVNSLWQNRDSSGMKGQDLKLLETYFKAFVDNGALLNADQKSKVSTINQRLSTLSLQFAQNMLHVVNAYKLIVTNVEDLKGLPISLLEAAIAKAKDDGLHDAWTFSLQNSSLMPFMTYASNRSLRKEMWEVMINKCNQNDAQDNKAIIRETLLLRQQRANILGFKNHGAYILKDRMAKSPENVNELLQKLWKGIMPLALADEKLLQEMMDADGVNDKLQPYDWRYYAEKLRITKYDLDEEMLKPYFELSRVNKGMFDVATQLYGITFTSIHYLPTYHRDVTTYQVHDSDGQMLGILYMDYYPRPSKQGGAWMTSYLDQHMDNGKRVCPVISIVCNFTLPTSDTPALLTYDEVNTLFHEFGHALHGLLSDVTYRSLAGTNVPTDFVELPSQIMENWAADSQVLRDYAKHYQTGDTISDEIIAKLEATDKYGQGFALIEYLAASILDMRYHSVDANEIDDIEEFENQLWDEIGMPSSIISRYRSTYFSHIFGGGYSAGYYSYIWSEVLDADAYAYFKEKGIFDKAIAQDFRDHILSRGGTVEPDELYRRFRGRDPEISALLAKKGF